MTYYKLYSTLKTEEELFTTMKRDIKIACFWGGNRDRVKAIKEAGEKVAKEKGWLHK